MVYPASGTESLNEAIVFDPVNENDPRGGEGAGVPARLLTRPSWAIVWDLTCRLPLYFFSTFPQYQSLSSQAFDAPKSIIDSAP